MQPERGPVLLCRADAAPAAQRAQHWSLAVLRLQVLAMEKRGCQPMRAMPAMAQRVQQRSPAVRRLEALARKRRKQAVLQGHLPTWDTCALRVMPQPRWHALAVACGQAPRQLTFSPSGSARRPVGLPVPGVQKHW